MQFHQKCSVIFQFGKGEGGATGYACPRAPLKLTTPLQKRSLDSYF